MKYPFYFQVKLLFDDEPSFYALQSGLGLAESYAEAAKQVDEYFYDTLVSIEHLEFGEDTGPLFLMPDKVCHNFIHDDSFANFVKCNEDGEILKNVN